MAYKKKTEAETAEKNPSLQAQAAQPAKESTFEADLISFSLIKKGTYWCVVKTTTDGARVVSQVLGKPLPKAAALIEFRITMGRFMQEKSR